MTHRVHIDYDDPLLEPTARGHLLAREPICIAVEADAVGLRLLATLLPDELGAALSTATPHPSPRSSLVLYAARIGGMVRMAQREGFSSALRVDEPLIYIDMNP